MIQIDEYVSEFCLDVLIEIFEKGNLNILNEQSYRGLREYLGLPNSETYYTLSYILKVCSKNVSIEFISKFGHIMEQLPTAFLQYVSNENKIYQNLDELLNDMVLSTTSVNVLKLLFDAGYKNDYITEVMDNLSKLIEIKPNLDIKTNQSLIWELLTNKVVNKYGLDVIALSLEYDSGASRILVNLVDDNLITNWIEYINHLPIYDKKFFHYAVLNYENSKSLIESLINSNIDLTEVQLKNLKEILVQRNRYGVNDIESLTNYREHRNKFLQERLQSDEISEVKDAAIEILFNVTLKEKNSIFNSYGLVSEDFVNFLLSENVLTIEDIASLKIIEEIANTNDITELKTKIKEIIGNGSITSLKQIEDKLIEYYEERFNESLFNPDGIEKDGITYTTVQGVDDPNVIDIYGNTLTSDTTIQVVNLHGVDFKLIVHKLATYAAELKKIAGMIIQNPALWNLTDGSSTLSTSMISNNHIYTIPDHPERQTVPVYYGFNNISQSSILFMAKEDLNVEHGNRKFEPEASRNQFMLPETLQYVSGNNRVFKYNEIVLERGLQPDCIICFDGNINDESKKAAQYFGIPIYVIDTAAYSVKTKAQYDAYKSGNINSFEISDVEKILYSQEDSINNNYNLFLTLSDQSLEKGLIDSEQYIEILNEGRRLISDYLSIEPNANINLDEITNRINSVKTE